MNGADFLLLVHEDEQAHLAQTPKDMAELLAAQGQFAESLSLRGCLHDFGRLRPSREGKRVHSAGVTSADDPGPVSPDGSRALALYYWVRAATVDEAFEVGAECPTLPTDRVEVRSVMKAHVHDDDAPKPGKIFGFVVRGAAASRGEWTVLMDRMDAETSNAFPREILLRGVRLEPPREGSRPSLRGERFAPADGPFYESKEVIGGLFFMRFPALDDAVEWASRSRFVVHGTLEVREVWRS